MIKDELLHTHQLLSEIADHLEKKRGIPVEFDEYEDVGVGPYEVFKNKNNHERAVKAFGADVGRAVEESEPNTDDDEMTVVN